MKIRYESGQICQVSVVDILDSRWTIGKDLMIDNALECAKDIIEGRYIFRPSQVKRVHIIDEETGALLITCFPDDPKPIEEDYQESFNEDCGFDPYLGCYTEDC